jgi:tRNA G18 (ribose-2'-O)-methylase SpoU
VATFVVPPQVMTAVTGFHIHRGCLAIGDRGAPLDWPTLTAAARRVVVLERVANADNVGSIFRNAAAFGADAVLLGPDCIDPLYRKAIRTSMAATLLVPFAHMDSWPDALQTLRASGFRVLGLSPRLDACALRQVVATLDQAPVAIVAGHEGDGLTREAMDACDALTRIPMTPDVDSLNVAMAVGIALYELSSMRNGQC